MRICIDYWMVLCMPGKWSIKNIIISSVKYNCMHIRWTAWKPCRNPNWLIHILNRSQNHKTFRWKAIDLNTIDVAKIFDSTKWWWKLGYGCCLFFSTSSSFSTDLVIFFIELWTKNFISLSLTSHWTKRNISLFGRWCKEKR